MLLEILLNSWIIVVFMAQDTASRTTTKSDGVIIIDRTVGRPTPTPEQTVIACNAVTIECPGGLTVQVNRVYTGRSKDSTCTKDKAGCCPSVLDDTLYCFQEITSVLPVQRHLCEQFVGKPCPILEPNKLPLTCNGSNENTYFSATVFQCIYVPTTTSNITTMTTTPSETTSTETSSTSPTSTVKTIPPTTTTTTEEELPIPLIAWAAGGGLLFLILLIILIICCHRRQKQRNQREDMTKPGKSELPVKDIGVNYMDEEKVNSSSDPDIIKTASPSNDIALYNMQNGH